MKTANGQKLPPPNVLRAKIEAGSTTNEIMLEYGVSTRTRVFGYCRRHGIPMPSDHNAAYIRRRSVVSEPSRLEEDDRKVIVYRSNESGCSSSTPRQVPISLPRIPTIHGHYRGASNG